MHVPRLQAYDAAIRIELCKHAVSVKFEGGQFKGNGVPDNLGVCQFPIGGVDGV